MPIGVDFFFLPPKPPVRHHKPHYQLTYTANLGRRRQGKPSFRGPQPTDWTKKKIQARQKFLTKKFVAYLCDEQPSGFFKSASSMALLKVWVPADLLAKTVLLLPPQITCEAPQTSLRAGIHCYSGFVKAIIVETRSESRWWDVASGNLVLFTHSSVPIHWVVPEQLNYNSVHTCFISILDLA